MDKLLHVDDGGQYEYAICGDGKGRQLQKHRDDLEDLVVRREGVGGILIK